MNRPFRKSHRITSYNVCYTKLLRPSFETYTLRTVLEAAVPYAAPLFLGTTIVGLAAAALAYVVVYRIAVRVKSARHKGMSGKG